jgi:hypothetical protein
LERPKGSWVGYGAALWALIFSAFHVVWATGWYIGLSEAPAKGAFQQRWFLLYDLIIAGMCAVGVFVALALVLPWGRRLPRALLGLVAWSGIGLLVLRAGAGVVQAAYLAARGKFPRDPMMLWEVWFCLGAFLFSLSLWRFQRVSASISR